MENCYLRKVTSDDMKLLYAWVNDKLVRESAFNSEKISFDEHRSWFSNSLNNTNRHIYILMLFNDPIGQIRFDIENNVAEIDYSVDSRYRNQGFGSKLIRLGIKEIKKDVSGIEEVIGKVKCTNLNSRKCFIKNGFVENGKICDSDSEIVEYRKSTIV